MHIPTATLTQGAIPAFAGFRRAGGEARDRAWEHAKRHLELVLRQISAEGDAMVGTGRAAALLSFADSLLAELIVVGTHGRFGLRRVLLGSVAERVTRAASMSVLVVHLKQASGQRSLG